MVHVCYTLHDESGRYSKLAAASMLSMFENTSELVTVHIIIDNSVPKDAIEKLKTVAWNYGQYTRFYNVDELIPERIAEVKKAVPAATKHWASIAAFYRLMIDSIVPNDIPRIIYLDADTIINRDIKECYSVDMKNFPLAAVTAFSNGVDQNLYKRFYTTKTGMADKQDYFNAGVFILDLEQARNNSEDLLTRCLNFLREHPNTDFQDQDALNVIFNHNYLKLPNSFNRYTNYSRIEDGIQKFIYHYNGTILRVWSKSPYNRLWFEYFVKTPFCTPDVFGNFRQAVDKYTTDYKNLTEQKLKTIQQVFKLVTTRQRVFFAAHDDQAEIEKTIGFDGFEIGLNAKAQNAVENLIQQMKQTNSADSKQKRIFLIKIPAQQYGSVRKRLLEERFIENEDFVNVDNLFTAPVLNMPLSYRFILQM